MKKSVSEIFFSIPFGLTTTERIILLCEKLHANEDGRCGLSAKELERETGIGKTSTFRAINALTEKGLLPVKKEQITVPKWNRYQSQNGTDISPKMEQNLVPKETEKEKTKEESKTENKDKEQEKENTKLCCLRKVQGTFGFPPKPETKTDAEKAPVEPRAQPVAETPSAADTPSNPEAFALKAEPVKEAAPSRKRPEPRPRDFAEVEDYARKHGYDPSEVDKWYARNVAIGWMIGKNPVKNWKASLAYWMSSAAQSRYQR